MAAERERKKRENSKLKSAKTGKNDRNNTFTTNPIGINISYPK